MRIFDRNGRQDDADTAPLDPVAVTLAVWLAMVVAVTGLVRLSHLPPGSPPADMPSAAAPFVAMQLSPYGT